MKSKRLFTILITIFITSICIAQQDSIKYHEKLGITKEQYDLYASDMIDSKMSEEEIYEVVKQIVAYRALAKNSTSSDEDAILVSDLDVKTIMKSTLLLVSFTNPCPDCTKKDFKKKTDLLPFQLYIAGENNRLYPDLFKIFNNYNGKYKIITEELYNSATYQDSIKYPYVLRPDPLPYQIDLFTNTGSSIGGGPGYIGKWIFEDRKNGTSDPIRVKGLFRGYNGLIKKVIDKFNNLMK